MEESSQIIQLLNDEKTTFKNISYKSFDRIKLNNFNNNSFSNNRIKFNAQSISNQLVLYQDTYILIEVDIEFNTAAHAIPVDLRLKNSYEMVNSLKIELNRTIITNEDYIYYSNMIPHSLENSKSDDFLYRGIDLHDKTTFETNTDKNIFITNSGDTVKVRILIFLKDKSDYFRQLTFPLEFCEYDISLQIVKYRALLITTPDLQHERIYVNQDIYLCVLCVFFSFSRLSFTINVSCYTKVWAISPSTMRYRSELTPIT